MRDRIWLGFNVGIEFNLVLVLVSKMTCFWAGDQLTVCGPKLTCLSIMIDCLGSRVGGDRNRLGLGMPAANCLFLVSASRLTYQVVFVWVVDIDLISVRGIDLDLISV